MSEVVQGIAAKVPVEIEPEPDATVSHRVCTNAKKAVHTLSLSEGTQATQAIEGRPSPSFEDLCWEGPETKILWTSRKFRNFEPWTPLLDCILFSVTYKDINALYTSFFGTEPNQSVSRAPGMLVISLLMRQVPRNNDAQQDAVASKLQEAVKCLQPAHDEAFHQDAGSGLTLCPQRGPISTKATGQSSACINVLGC